MNKKINYKEKSSIFISIDMDDNWCINKKNSFLRQSFRNIFKIFFNFNVKPTLFIIAKDVNNIQDLLEDAKNFGYELGNHSLSHIYLDGLSEEKISREILQSHQILSKIAPIYGFRAPGWSTNSQVDKLLIKNNYLYDASRVQGIIFVLLKFLYFFIGKNYGVNNSGRIYGRTLDLIGKGDKSYDRKLKKIKMKTIFQLPFYNSFFKLFPIFFIRILLILESFLGNKKKVSFIFHARDFIGSDLEKTKNIINLLTKFYNPISSKGYIKNTCSF